MLIIKEVKTKSQLEELKLKQDIVNNKYLYILDDTILYVDSEGETYLGKTPDDDELRKALEGIPQILDHINRKVV